jgi:hypothetical protein
VSKAAESSVAQNGRMVVANSAWAKLVSQTSSLNRARTESTQIAAYVSQVPAHSSPTASFYCEHCKKSFKEGVAAITAGGERVGAKEKEKMAVEKEEGGREKSEGELGVVIGVYSTATEEERRAAAKRDLPSWLTMCSRWYHPRCAKLLNRNSSIHSSSSSSSANSNLKTLPLMIEYGNLKFTELLTVTDRMALIKAMM